MFIIVRVHDRIIGSALQKNCASMRVLKPGSKTGNGNSAAFGPGLAFAFGWTPCIGPILATILTLAASSDSLTQGTVLLTAYALGLGVPFILTSLGVSHFLQTSARLKQNMRTIEISTGILLAATGILIYLGSLQSLASHLLDWMPFLAKLG